MTLPAPARIFPFASGLLPGLRSHSPNVYHAKLTMPRKCSYASMQGGFSPHKRKLRLQLRASQMKAGPGKTFWSTPVRLDALGGAAVVAVPSPIQGGSSSAGTKAGYIMAVTATQVGC